MLTPIKEEIDSNTIIVGDFNTPLSSMDGSSRQKINKETQALNDILDQMDLIDIYKAFHPKAADLNNTIDQIDLAEFCTPQLTNTHSSQVHTEHYPK